MGHVNGWSHVFSTEMLSLFFSTLLTPILLVRGAELWESDVSSAMKIGLSTTGYKSVDLRCESDNFSVNVTLEHHFEGVVYTRGSFNEKKLPCFKRHDQSFIGKDKKLLISLRIPFHKCLTLMDVAESRYTNTLVVQHDPELIMPGDAAFSLDCAFVPEFKSQMVKSHGSKEAPQELPFKSKITLVDADPSEKSDSANRNVTVFSKSERVSFVPDAGENRDEL